MNVWPVQMPKPSSVSLEVCVRGSPALSPWTGCCSGYISEWRRTEGSAARDQALKDLLLAPECVLNSFMILKRIRETPPVELSRSCFDTNVVSELRKPTGVRFSLGRAGDVDELHLRRLRLAKFKLGLTPRIKTKRRLMSHSWLGSSGCRCL
jgi:hypothetical protein